MRQFRLLLSVVLIVALVSSSNTPSESTIENNGLNPNLVESITYATPYDFAEFSFYTKSSYVTYQWTSAIQASLVKRSGANNSWVPDLITTMPAISPDHLTYTFTLKDNLYFSNGFPLTIQDVNFSLFVAIDSNINIANSYLYSGYLNYNSFNPISANTFSLTLLQPYAISMDIFAFPIVPQATFNSRYESCMYGSINSCTWDAPDGSDAVSAGPFMVQSIDTVNQIVTLDANPLYYDADMVKTDRIIFEKIADKLTAISALTAGSIDIMDAQYIPALNELAGISGISEAFATDYPLQEMSLNHKHPYFGTGFGIPGNQGLDPLNQTDRITAQNDAKLVRHAMSLIMNRDVYVNNIMAGLAQPATSIVNPSQDGYDPLILPYPYNVTEARQLMTTAGFNYTSLGTPDVNGVYPKSFFNITVLSPNTNPARNQWSYDYVLQLPKIGIGVTQHISTGWAEIIPRTFGSLVDPPLYDGGGYDVFFVGYSFSADFSASNLYTAAGSCSTGNCENFYNFDLKEELSPIANLSRTIDSEYNFTMKLQEIGNLEQLLSDWLPSIPILHPKSHWSFRSDVIGLQPVALASYAQDWVHLYKSGFVNNVKLTTPISTSSYYPTSSVPVTSTTTVTAYPPMISGPTELTVVSGTSGNSLLWTVYSDNPNNFDIYVDGVYRTGGSYVNGGTIGLGLDDLGLGDFTVVITVYDTYGQFTSLTTIVHVVNDPSTIPTDTSSIPPDTLTSTTSHSVTTSSVENPSPKDESSTGPGLPVPVNAYLILISLLFIGIVRYKFDKR